MSDIIAGDPAPTNPTDELTRLRTRVEELETFARGCDGEGCVLPHSSWCRTAREFAAKNSGCTCGEPWTDSPQTHSGHCWLLSPPDDELEWHRKRVAELLARVAELEAGSASQAPDPIAYGPRGYRCGCGKDAHSNLVPCTPDPADRADLRAEVLDQAADLLAEIGTPIYGVRSEHERGVMYASERLRKLIADGGDER